MIDDLSILVSTLVCVFIIWRAAVLDRQLPWFPAEPRPDVVVSPETAAWTPDWEQD